MPGVTYVPTSDWVSASRLHFFLPAPVLALIRSMIGPMTKTPTRSPAKCGETRNVSNSTDRGGVGWNESYSKQPK